MKIDIRRIRPSDAQAVSAFYAELSAESRHSRFLGFSGGAAEAVSRTFCAPDHMHEEGFVAVAATGQLVGHLCMVDAGRSRVEIGVAVADDWQGSGIGRQLFEAALRWARDRGIETVVASCFADNWRVLALLSSSHRPSVTAANGGVVDVVIPMRGPVPRALSLPPYPRVAHRRAVSRRRGASRRTRPPVRVVAG